MFDKPTLFVVGAGASKEVGLPTGNDLKSTIANLINIRFDDWGRTQKTGDLKICQALKIHVESVDGQHGDINPYLHAGWQISRALPLAISIDNYFEAHGQNQQVELCGKLAITKSILDAERRSKLYFDESDFPNTLRLNNLEQTWYNPFFRILTEGCDINNTHDLFTNVSFITFNYDRCIEHYLFHALQIYYGLESQVTTEIMQGLKIVHPYGQVGKHPWGSVHDAIGFGSEIGGLRLLEISQQIKTFTETVGSQESEVISNLVQQAETIVFLGFAFHKQNMEILQPAVKPIKSSIYATAKGFSNNDCDVIKERIRKLVKYNKNEISAALQLDNQLTCSGLFSDFQLSLTQ